MSGSFFDSNILLYFVSSDLAKSERAKSRVRDGGTISVQVLNEVANVARRKMRMDWAEIADVLGVFRGLLTVRPLTVDIHELGLRIAARHRLSIYDAMIVASALEAGCEVLYSEDMHHGTQIEGGLRIANPFA
ncbi:MAG TPA: PIN domain-containing protein [Devosia sp.]|nr:PIN domain-containing protein [Devosia sp.]